MMVVVAETEEGRRRRGRDGGCGGVAEEGGDGETWRRRDDRRRALVALGEEPEAVDLPREVGDAGPSAEPEADYQHPDHHEGVDGVRSGPPPQKPRRRLHRILRYRRGH